MTAKPKSSKSAHRKPMPEDEPSAEDLLIKPFDYYAVIQQQLEEIEQLRSEIVSMDAEIARLKEGRLLESNAKKS